jgi:protein-S-isoprenylcysteine O-methyltransferase Ste14
MRRHVFPKRYADFVARLRVFLGFAMVAAFAYFSHPAARSLWIGLPISLCGLGLRAWAAGHLRKNQALAESGPYAYTRNPLYLGTFITALGFAAAARSVGLAVLFTAVFLLVYLPAIELEEQHLIAILPAYAAYAARVPLIAPRWSASRGPERFSFAQYHRNREYEALIGWSAGAAWLIARAVFGF